MPSLSDEPEDFSKEIRGRVEADPAVAAPIGSVLHFEAGLLTAPNIAKASWLRSWDTFHGMLLSMHFNVGGEYSVDGSAVLVAPGVALCAAHVITPHHNQIMCGDGGFICIGLAKDGMQIWRPTHYTLVPDTDLCILGLQYAASVPPDGLFHQATISTRLPALGEDVLLCGFRSSSFSKVSDTELQCDGNVLLCRGQVTQQFPTGRDKVMLPWPCLEIACPAFGGMSGGPVFDTSGRLVGLVCSSFATSEHEGPAYISLLWPSLVKPFSGGWPGGLIPNPTTLLEIDPRLCGIEGRDAIHQDASQGLYTVRAWT